MHMELPGSKQSNPGRSYLVTANFKDFPCTLLTSLKGTKTEDREKGAEDMGRVCSYAVDLQAVDR